MSILGYSSSYFLPEYWAGTPLYGEKIIPLLDYILSTDFVDSDKLAGAFYNIENKYKNTADLPIEQIKAIIEESGYSYVLDLLGEDEESIRLLTYLLVLIHQFKGSKKGLQLVLSLLKREGKALEMKAVGDIVVPPSKEVSGFTTNDYVIYSGFTTDNDPFELTFPIRTREFTEEQCIASSAPYGFYLGILSNGRLVLSLGNNKSSWNIADRVLSVNTLAPETNYFVKLAFDGVSYEVTVSTDGKKYTNYINISSNTPLKVHKGVIYIGVDGSEGSIAKPFSGYINLGPFAVDVDNIAIEEWFEGEEVGEENTFSVKADLDMGVLSSEFFKNFASFTKKYVYPSLNAFEARMNLDCELAFLPYVRQRISYTALVDLLTFVQFMTKVYDYKNVYLPDAFTVVGSPTVTEDGIASGFSNGNYLMSTSAINLSSANSWEIICGFNLSEIASNNRFLVGYNVASNWKGMCFGVVNGVLVTYLGSTGESWDIYNGLRGHTTLSTNTKYIAKLEFNGTQYIISLSTDNGVSWNIENTLNSTTHIFNPNKEILIGLNYLNSGGYLPGSIDLKQFSITVDGKEVFSGGTYEWEDFYTVNEDDGQEYDAFQVLEQK